MNLQKLAFAGIFITGISTGIFLGAQDISLVSAADAKEPGRGEPFISPTDARERNFYAPNSETLKPDEMRVIACGTGMQIGRASCRERV